MDQRPETEEPSAERLKQDWESRSRSEYRDFYVASHPGWDDPAHWERRAEADLLQMLHGVDLDSIAGWQVLEIGCGVGRLAPGFARRVAGYTGFDIAPGMIEEARRRHGSLANVRFLESDGLGVPAAAADRAYDLILVLAVFIHCPRSVIAANVRSAYPLLAPGGQLRFQVMADPGDPSGVVSLEAAQELHEEMMAAEAVSPEQLGLIDNSPYIGHRFRYAELAPFLEELTGGRVTTVRVDLAHVYGWIERP